MKVLIAPKPPDDPIARAIAEGKDFVWMEGRQIYTPDKPDLPPLVRYFFEAEKRK